MHSSRMRTGRSLTVCWSLLRGGVSAPGRCLLRGGVCFSGGMSAPGMSAPGGCLLGGVSDLGGSALGGVVSQYALSQTPPCEQNDKQAQKYYLGHNFVAAAKYDDSQVLLNLVIKYCMKNLEARSVN